MRERDPSEIGDDLTAVMRGHAVAFAEQHGLDFSLDSLEQLERIVKAESRARARGALTRWGAYLGETIIRASGTAAIHWVDFATAARDVPAIAQLGLTEDTAALLAAGSTHWFPLAKIEKFLAHGAQDSPAAFARVVAAGEIKLPERRDQPIDPAAIDPARVEIVDAFCAAASATTLEALASCRVLGRGVLVYLLRERGARSEMFYPFFGAAPGRGRFAFDPGHAAATFVWMLIENHLADFTVEAAQLAPMLAAADRPARENAAYVLGCGFFQIGDPDAGAKQYAAGDAAIRRGTLRAIRDIVLAAVSKDITLRDAATFAPVLSAGLQGSGEERTIALAAIQQIAVRIHGDITSVLGPLLEVLADGKPEQVEHALQALTGQANKIKHRSAQFDPRVATALAAVIRHSQALPGKGKPTKVQIAARYALSAYRGIDQHLDPTQRAELERAFAAISHVR